MKNIVLILVLNILILSAQNEMSVEDAIQLGLKNNFDIQIARNNAEIAENNKTLGTSGLLPTPDANGGYQL